MFLIGIDERYVREISRIIVKYSGFFESNTIDIFDTRYYPPPDLDNESVLRYFLVMVAMDHRLSRPGKPYEACLEDGCYHGADLLYRLGVKMLLENPSFFDPSYLRDIRVEQVINWLSVSSATPPDPYIRAMLLRDLGLKLLKLYNSSVESILEGSRGYLRGGYEHYGLLDYLRVFRAYEDPVEKKSLLFVKFITARKLFNPRDKPSIPVDNHLTRIALRLGLVMVSGKLWDKIRSGLEVSTVEDILLRFAVREAYDQLINYSGLDIRVLDDFLWNHGRRVCLKDKPICDICVFRVSCFAYCLRNFMVNEHVYYNTWYY
ncbi:MAG: iron-sulfur cluster loop [Desulfurococcaceae archaeon]